MPPRGGGGQRPALGRPSLYWFWLQSTNPQGWIVGCSLVSRAVVKRLGSVTVPSSQGDTPTFCERGRTCLAHRKSTGSRFTEPREYTTMGVDCWVVCRGSPLQYTPTFCERQVKVAHENHQIGRCLYCSSGGVPEKRNGDSGGLSLRLDFVLRSWGFCQELP